VDPLGELGEEVDFFADAVDGSGGVGFVFDDEAGAVEEGTGGGEHGFRGELAEVVGIEPLEFGGVEAGVAGVDLAGVEELDEGLAVELFGSLSSTTRKNYFRGMPTTRQNMATFGTLHQRMGQESSYTSQG
jgi:hypothetical protein